MKNAIKFGKQVFAVLFFLFGFLASTFSHPPLINCDCLPPSVTITSQTAGTVSFSWSSVGGATGYKVWYQRKNGGYTSPVSVVTTNSASFSNLPSGTYAFYFATLCGGAVSEIIITDDLIL